MEQTWAIKGCYANWRLTVTATPPEEPEEEHAPDCDFQGIADYFSEVVNRYELGRDMDRLGSGQGWRLM
ncbi:hypothetical protein CFN78_02245 [Amycolatopsis antarctica]|uniref:Uncharacterized protein n=1 Tax=Amycolatopsis antarctica TaxID=1854586 RepID=A0A263DBF2_9PSEU|nr:hypothetical protein [Amycolatopsis antarctica]OZM75308.1 hypothetical protein CFN78_02245 [Amycolatopsis antarctica]